MEKTSAEAGMSVPPRVERKAILESYSKLN